MIDHVSRQVRSRMMSAVRSKDTEPELFVRRALHRAGYRFRLHGSELPGKPDIVLPRFRFAVFVHGCFWHGHCCPRGKLPASNFTFWQTKIDGNVARDERTVMALRKEKWTPVVIWACEIDKGVARLLKRLQGKKARDSL